MKPRVYIETSIPSFYHETRRDASAVARKHIRHINIMLGLYVPVLVTPLELLGEVYE